MGQVIKLTFSSYNKDENLLYEKKLIRIRDEIEDYLKRVSSFEKDELAVALASKICFYETCSIDGKREYSKIF